MLEVPHAGRDFAVLVDKEEMPALLVLGGLMPAVRGQLLAGDGAIGEVDVAAEALNLLDPVGVFGQVNFNVFKSAGYDAMGGSKHQESLVEASDASFE